jgi:hypothetical protein
MEMVLFINGNASILPCSMEMVLLINGNAFIASLPQISFPYVFSIPLSCQLMGKNGTVSILVRKFNIGKKRSIQE